MNHFLEIFSDDLIGTSMTVTLGSPPEVKGNYSADVSSECSSDYGSQPDYTEQLKVLYKSDQRTFNNNANWNNAAYHNTVWRPTNKNTSHKIGIYSSLFLIKWLFRSHISQLNPTLEPISLIEWSLLWFELTINNLANLIWNRSSLSWNFPYNISPNLIFAKEKGYPGPYTWYSIFLQRDGTYKDLFQ